MNGVLAKIGGWAQFALQLLGQVATHGAPHGIFSWLTLIGSLTAAVGIHAASNVGQVQPMPGPSTVPASTAHVVQ